MVILHHRKVGDVALSSKVLQVVRASSRKRLCQYITDMSAVCRCVLQATLGWEQG